MSKAFDLRKALDAAVLGTFRRHVAAPARGADSSDTAIADALDELRDRFLAAIAQLEAPTQSGPAFDTDGYPTEETLARIREWPCETWADFEAVMDFAGRAWSDPQYWEKDAAFLERGIVPGSIRRLLRYVF